MAQPVSKPGIEECFSALPLGNDGEGPGGRVLQPLAVSSVFFACGYIFLLVLFICGELGELQEIPLFCRVWEV